MKPGPGRARTAAASRGYHGGDAGAHAERRRRRFAPPAGVPPQLVFRSPPVSRVTRPTDPRAAVAFVLKLGRALHSGGAASYRLEDALRAVSAALGIRAQFFAAPTELMYAFDVDGEERTAMQRTEPGEVDLGRLAALEAVTLAVIRGSLGPAEAGAEIDRIALAPPPWPAGAVLIAFGTASASAAWFFGGRAAEIGAALLAGLAIGALLRFASGRPVLARLGDLGGAVIAAFLGSLAACLVAPVAAPVITLAGIIVLLPGVTLTTAVGELAQRHLASGTVRLSGALVVLLFLGFGAAAGDHMGRIVGGWLDLAPFGWAPAPLPGWSEVAALLTASLSFAVLFQAPRRDSGWIVLLCALAYLGNALGARAVGPEVGAFLGALTAGVGSALLSRLLDRPAVVTRVPAMTLLVPGSIGFLSFSSLLSDDVTAGVRTAFQVAVVAISLVTGLLVANVVVPPRRLL